MKKKYVEQESENEFSADEPEEFQESSDDWTPASGDASGRRQSRRLRNSTSKKPRLVEPSSSEDSDVESEDSNSGSKKKGKGRGRQVSRVKVQKKPTNTNSNTNDTVKRPAESVVSCEATSTTSPPVQKEFSSGAYVVLKTDIQNGGDPPIWKIDGKALLQKYVPFEQDGKKLYKNTSTYSGWSITNKDLYYPAPITFKVQNRKEIIVEFHKDQVKATTPHPEDSE